MEVVFEKRSRAEFSPESAISATNPMLLVKPGQVAGLKASAAAWRSSNGAFGLKEAS